MADKLDASSAWVGAIATVVLPALLIGSSLWSGFALEHLWNWFAEPLLRVRISLGEAVGLMLIRAALFPTPLKKKGEETEGSAMWAQMLVAPALWLAVGWGAHQWLMP